MQQFPARAHQTFYIDRWDFSGEYDRSFYAGAMIKVDVTGTTATIEVLPWKPTLRFAYRIDGNPIVKVASTGGSTKGANSLYLATFRRMANEATDGLRRHEREP